MTSAGPNTGLNSVGSALVRLNADGTLEMDFLANYVPLRRVGYAQAINSLAMQPDGKILVCAGRVGLVRLNSDGTRDNGFQMSSEIVPTLVNHAPTFKIEGLGREPWVRQDAIRNWTAVATSTDGAVLVAAEGGGRIYPRNGDG